jgi:hypothetical protein
MSENLSLNSVDQLHSVLAHQDYVEFLRLTKRDSFKGYVLPLNFVYSYSLPENGNYFSTPLWLADRDYEVIEATERHDSSSSLSGVLFLRRIPPDKMPVDGSNIFSTGWELGPESTANHPITLYPVESFGSSVSGVYDRVIPKGYFLGLYSRITLLTGLKGVNVSVLLRAI